MAARKNSRNQQQKTLPWSTMFISFAVGAFVMFLFHLNDTVPVEEKANKPAKTAVAKKPKVIEPTFDFYTLLPEMEVVVESPKQTTQKQIVTSPPQTPVPSQAKKAAQVSYMIQVGSFKKADDADGFRARLALLGIESKVQTVTIDNKDTWHRVQIGPISGRNSADKLQKQLKQNSIDSLLMRARHG